MTNRNLTFYSEIVRSINELQNAKPLRFSDDSVQKTAAISCVNDAIKKLQRARELLAGVIADENAGVA